MCNMYIEQILHCYFKSKYKYYVIICNWVEYDGIVFECPWPLSMLSSNESRSCKSARKRLCQKIGLNIKMAPLDKQMNK